MEQALEVMPDKQNEMMTAMTANQIKMQVQLIQEIMRDVMKENEHYGKIPGCGDKNALFKSGAEKLNLTFRFDPDFQVEPIDMGGGHREYRVKCVMYSIITGRRQGSGVGSCSTMEAKYRYRVGPVEFTGRPVPKEYWDLRKSDPKKALDLLGGKGFVTKKNDAGGWEIAKQGERVEHDNPADYYNTVLKMAKKRAMVDAVLTVTAASDIFTQDIEEMIEEEPAPKAEAAKTAEAPAEPKKEAAPQQPDQTKFLSSMADMRAKLGDSEFFLILGRHGVEGPEEISDRKKQIEVFKEMTAKLPKGVA